MLLRVRVTCVHQSSILDLGQVLEPNSAFVQRTEQNHFKASQEAHAMAHTRPKIPWYRCPHSWERARGDAILRAANLQENHRRKCSALRAEIADCEGSNSAMSALENSNILQGAEAFRSVASDQLMLYLFALWLVWDPGPTRGQNYLLLLLFDLRIGSDSYTPCSLSRCGDRASRATKM